MLTTMCGPTTARKIDTMRRRRIVREARNQGAVNRYELLDKIYKLRRCFVCGADYWCKDREPAVDLAEAAAERTASAS